MIPELFCGVGARLAAQLRAQELLGQPARRSPDFLALEGERALGIDQVRELILWARYGPVGRGVRVALLGPAERLTPEAANALLKLLEETPPYLAVLLHGEAPDRVLPTVRSRCALRWAPPPRDLLGSSLARAGYTPQEIAFLLDLTAEREEEALAFVEAKRDVWGEWAQAQAEARELGLRELAERLPGEVLDPLRRRAFAEAFLEKVQASPAHRVLEAAEILARSRAVREVLQELAGVLCAQARRAPERVGWARRALLARGELEANANPRLLLEGVLLWPRRG